DYSGGTRRPDHELRPARQDADGIGLPQREHVGAFGSFPIRLRFAWADFGPFLIGQAASLFMDYDVYPNVLDYQGPAGMVLMRQPISSVHGGETYVPPTDAGPEWRVRHSGKPWSVSGFNLQRCR